MSFNSNGKRDPNRHPEKLETGSPSSSEGWNEAIFAVEEKRLTRKLDYRILPIMSLLYLFAYLDRSNLGNARLQGLPQDILHGDSTGKQFDWLTSVFFIPYVICQVPATVASKLFPPRVWMFCSAVGWGLASTLVSTSTNFAGVMTARVFLGIFEACFGPATVVYFSLFYTRKEMGMRIGYWFGFAAVAGAFGGLIAFGIQHSHVHLAQWRLLFIIEGIPAIVLGFVALFFLPNRPESTTYLTERERMIAVDRMNRATSGDAGAMVNKAHIGLAFKDWRVYVAGVIYFGMNAALASISAFLPTILKTLGFANATAQLLTVPPYAVATAVLLLFSYISDKKQTRGIPMAVSSCIGGIGYMILLFVQHNNRVRYFATFCITAGTYTTIGLIIAWFSHNLGSETKKATGIPIFMAIGQCGSILGSHLYPLREGPHYTKGFAINAGLQFLGVLCSIILTLSYRWENARRNELYGKPDEDARVDTHELADRAPTFRYMP